MSDRSIYERLCDHLFVIYLHIDLNVDCILFAVHGSALSLVSSTSSVYSIRMSDRSIYERLYDHLFVIYLHIDLNVDCILFAVHGSALSLVSSTSSVYSTVGTILNLKMSYRSFLLSFKLQLMQVAIRPNNKI